MSTIAELLQTGAGRLPPVGGSAWRRLAVGRRRPPEPSGPTHGPIPGAQVTFRSCSRTASGRPCWKRGAPNDTQHATTESRESSSSSSSSPTATSGRRADRLRLRRRALATHIHTSSGQIAIERSCQMGHESHGRTRRRHKRADWTEARLERRPSA